MTLRKSDDGLWYGRIEVLLVRVIDDETETLIGTASPFGSLLVEQYGDRYYVEEPRSWWEREGFTITEPPFLEEVRKAHWEHRRRERT